MKDKPAPRTIRPGEVVKIVIVLGSWIGGLVLRLRPAPASYVGGGLLIVGCVLLAYWARTARKL
ncbi:MAG TPA: hypothetical protein VFS15_25240 [Kofleriaceae bacterium]|nr:hypothetical protein [Kofleriaceae bacterium]